MRIRLLTLATMCTSMAEDQPIQTCVLTNGPHTLWMRGACYKWAKPQHALLCHICIWYPESVVCMMLLEFVCLFVLMSKLCWGLGSYCNTGEQTTRNKAVLGKRQHNWQFQCKHHDGLHPDTVNYSLENDTGLQFLAVRAAMLEEVQGTVYVGCNHLRR